MQKMKIPTNLVALNFHSEVCEHKAVVWGKEVVKQVPMVIFKGEKVCPICELEKQDKLIEDEQQHLHDNADRITKHRTLIRDSLVSDRTIVDARFDNYKATQDEQRTNKKQMMDLAEKYKILHTQLELIKRNKDLYTEMELKEQREKYPPFNTFLQGSPGAGKSHLAYSLLKDIHDSSDTVSCLYIDIDEMMRKIKDSFNNKDSKFTESYFINLLSEVDYLVLDDLGAEVGSIDTNRQATDFIQRVLRAALNARQDKSTITTSNLSSGQLKGMYDGKIISRLIRNPRYVVFKDTADYRVQSLPF